MESIRSRVFKILVKATKPKEFWTLSGNSFQKALKKLARQEHTPPKKACRKINIEKIDFGGFCYYMLKPKKYNSERRVFYIHGGGFVYEMTPFHWSFLVKLCQSLGAEIAVPIYPLLPKHTYEETYPFIYNLYLQELKKVRDPSDMILIGDSAGGGLSLSLAQYLKKKGVPQPGDIVLLSPTLDVTLRNKAMDIVEKNDPILSKPGIMEVRSLYGSDIEHTSYLASPLYGDLSGLGEVTLFIGTYDILYPDTKKLKAKMDDIGAKLNYYEYPKMLHVFPIFPIPEGRDAMKKIIKKLKNKAPIS